MPDSNMALRVRELLALKARATPTPWRADEYGGYIWGEGPELPSPWEEGPDMVADGSVDEGANPWMRLSSMAFNLLGEEKQAELKADPLYRECLEAVELIRKGSTLVIRMRGVGAELPIDENREFICAAANLAQDLCGRFLELEECLGRANALIAAEADARAEDIGRLRRQRDDELWAHSACLSVAEGTPGWEACPDESSPAVRKVKELRREYERLKPMELHLGVAREMLDRVNRHQKMMGGSPNEKHNESVWLEGAREMYLDIQKSFPLTAPADTYARQLLGMIREGKQP